MRLYCVCLQFFCSTSCYMSCTSLHISTKILCFFLIGVWWPFVQKHYNFFCQLLVDGHLDYFQFPLFLLLQTVPLQMFIHISLSSCTNIFVWRRIAISKDRQLASFNVIARWHEKQWRHILTWGCSHNCLEVVTKREENADLSFCTLAEWAASTWEDQEGSSVLWGHFILCYGGGGVQGVFWKQSKYAGKSV